MKLHSFHPFLCRLVIIVLLPVLISFSGCSGSHQAGSGPSSPPPPTPATVKGTVRGGQVPVTEATLQLYAVGTTGDGSLATPLLTQSVASDASGNFTLTGAYTCPSTSSLVYAAATGGNPGLGPGINNTASILIAALGPCDHIPASFIINEVTTVAAVWPLAPFMSAVNAIGSSADDANALSAAFTLSAQFANVTTGAAPGDNIPAGTTIPVNEINTLANILSACVNSAGGSAGDNTPCGQLFSLTTPPGGAPPTTIVAAGRLMEQNPAQNISQLFALIPANAPFTPALSIPPVDLSLSSTTPSALAVTPSSINFPSTIINFTSSPQTITLHNTGSTTINIGDVSLTGANAADFTSSSTCTSVLPSNQTCTIEVDFNPTVAGSKYAYLTIADSAGTVPVAIPLTGTATAGNGALTLTPSSLSFSQLSVPQSITLTNSSSSAIAIQSISLSNQNFTQTNTCGSNIATQASCTISVTATVANTDSATPLTATLSIVTSDTTGIHTVPLSTNIATVPGPLVVSPTSLAFATTGVPQVVTLTNSGTAPLTLQSITVADSNFGQTNTCGSTLAPSASCTVSVTANSLGTTPLTGALTIQANDAPGTHTVSLATNVTPVAGPLVASPTSLSFTTAGAPQTITLTNSGTAALTLQNIAIADSHFGQTNTCSSTLAPSASCTVSVTVNALDVAPLSSALTIQTNDATGTHTVPLSAIAGSGGSSQIAVSPLSLTFPATLINFTTPTQTITVTNNSPDFIEFGPSLTGAADKNYTVTTSCDFGMTATQSCTIQVAFTPITAGSHNGPLQLVFSTGQPSITIPLTGSSTAGTAQDLTLSASSLSFSQFGIPQPVTVTNNGSTPVAIGPITAKESGGEPYYAQTNNCGNSLEPQSICTIYVSATFLWQFPISGTLTLAAGDMTGIHTIPLTTPAGPISTFATTDTLAFGPWAIGTTSASLKFGASSYPNNVNLYGTITGPDAADFSLDAGAGQFCSDIQGCYLIVYYTPTTLGPHSATLVTNYGNISLTGTGIPAGASFSLTKSPPNPITGYFGMGSNTNSPFQISLVNNGSTSLNLSETITGPGASDYTITNPCPQNLSPSVTCTFNITFAPTQYGSRPATLAIEDTTSGTSQSVPLTGFSQFQPPTFSTFNSDFGNVQIGATSPPTLVTVTAPEGHPITASAGNGFNITPSSCSATPCQLSITFSPTDLGQYNVPLTVLDPVSGASTFVYLYGAGGIPEASLSTTSLDFASRNTGSTSIAQTVTLTNIGPQILRVSSISITGTDPSDFVQTNNCNPNPLPFSLTTNQSCTFSISFSPTAAGDRSATLQVLSNDPDSPTTLQLTGTATSP